MADVLIAFYSHSGNTRHVAELIREKTGGTLFELLPQNPYPTSYSAVLNQGRKEIQDGFHPPLAGKPENVSAYDTVIVGSPIWCSTMAPPLATFLAENDLSGKRIAPFCTHGGGGSGRYEKDVGRICAEASVTKSLVLTDNGGNAAANKVAKWLKEIES